MVMMLMNRLRAVTKQSPIMADHQSSSCSSATTPNPIRPVSSFLGSPRFFNRLLPKNLLPPSILDTNKQFCNFAGNPFRFSKNPEKPTKILEGGKHKYENFDSPRFFNSFLPKNLVPASILDTNKQYCNFAGNPFRFSKNPEKPRKILERNKHKSENFYSDGITLALVLVQEEHNGNICNKPNTSARTIMFGSALKIQIPNGSPESVGDFGIKTRNSRFSGSPNPAGFGSPRISTGPLCLRELELSEEYTRVISRGRNPKTTHIYYNCVVNGCCGIRVGSPQLESFLRFCQTCKKNLREGGDIFMYRGEKAFCSEECRCQEMFLDGLMIS